MKKEQRGIFKLIMQEEEMETWLISRGMFIRHHLIKTEGREQFLKHLKYKVRCKRGRFEAGT